MIYDLNLDVSILEEVIKIEILFNRALFSASYFLTVIVKFIREDDVPKAADLGMYQYSRIGYPVVTGHLLDFSVLLYILITNDDQNS